MTVVFYISGHGFGHAVRQTAIVNALAEARPDVRIVIRTSVAPWLFARNLRPRDARGDGGAVASVAAVQPAVVDIGAVQRGSLEVDVAETVATVAAFHRDIETLADAEARVLDSLDARLVVSDIPAVAFLAAARRSIPAVGISNFTWDWIYADYATEYPEARALVERIGRCYAHAAEGWRLPMSGGFETFPAVRDLPLVSRTACLTRTDVRTRLGLPLDTPLVLVSLGGFGAAGLDLAAAASSLRGVAEIVVTSYDACPPESGIRRLDEASMYGCGVQYEDLLSAVDIVASKPGYGIISDCAANDTALLYTSRGRFREYDVLVSQMPALVRCRFIPQPDLVEGRWRASVEHLLTAPPLSSPPRTDGAPIAASWLSSRL
jgi:UDP:flavonoid glycosyltransferase YjiC (YdhE family)